MVDTHRFFERSRIVVQNDALERLEELEMFLGGSKSGQVGTFYSLVSICFSCSKSEWDCAVS